MEPEAVLPEADSISHPRPKPSRQRDKPQLSCNPCRRRKRSVPFLLRRSRCDRQNPCSCCSSRGQICTYADNSGFTGISKRQSAAAAPAVHDRLVQLERLVVSLMGDSANRGHATSVLVPDSARSVAHGTPTMDTVMEAPIDGHSECGSMRIGESELRYVGGDHWAAILDGIADLKDHFDRDEQLRLANTPDQLPDEPALDPSRPKSGYALLLYGCRNIASRGEILEALPPKTAVDRYISRFFNYLDLVSACSYSPLCSIGYEAFWTNPSSVPIMWIGLLFSMICLACLTTDTFDAEVEYLSLRIDLYREKIVQCLMLGEYTRTGPYVLQTVINYVYIEFCLRTDADQDTWYLLALEINLAMRMGYHRDPSHFPGISPFEGEMRRRLWATVLMGDTLVSKQMGMPRMISDWKWDTKEPRNLNDTDFDEQSIDLPPSRPLTEYTNSLGLIARRRILAALGTVADLIDAVKPCSYADVMRVDGILQEAAASIPPLLQMKPLATSMTDSPQVIMSRLFLGHMVCKGQIILHRRFLYTSSANPDDDPMSYSRKACLDASLGMLNIQHMLDEETCPGGQLYTMRFRVTSIMNHQFLTATMVLCSMLYRGKTLQREQEIRAALQISRSIWMRKSSTSKEATKAAETVSFVLAKVSDSHKSNVSLDQDVSRDLQDNYQTNALLENSAKVTGQPLDEGLLLPDNMGLFEPDHFLTTGSFEMLTSSNQQGQQFGPNFNALESPADGWMVMNMPGQPWS
ncbi:unnamed protein product [Penicillium egyptiacum]|uniref:Xylanolytic transcriptional activator regulatory domain-containing protein n=1 Tax=Penicillium egyptiacum TaxID=1303716 RepID=A0A9W4P4R0_9EURO|nr:unnamed protein product [Penicillium egyptiacum]